MCRSSPFPAETPLPKTPLPPRNQGLPSPSLPAIAAAGPRSMAIAGTQASPGPCPIPTDQDWALVSPGSFSRCCHNVPAQPTRLLFFPSHYCVAAHRGSGWHHAPAFLGRYISSQHHALGSNSPVTPREPENTGLARDNSSHAGFRCSKPPWQGEDGAHAIDFTHILYTPGRIHAYMRTSIHTHTRTLGCSYATSSIAIHLTVRYRTRAAEK